MQNDNKIPDVHNNSPGLNETNIKIYLQQKDVMDNMKKSSDLQKNILNDLVIENFNDLDVRSVALGEHENEYNVLDEKLNKYLNKQ